MTIKKGKHAAKPVRWLEVPTDDEPDVLRVSNDDDFESVLARTLAVIRAAA